MYLPSYFYVYAYLREDGSPYYIGKGTGYRAFNNHRYITQNGYYAGIQMPSDKNNIIILEENLTEIGSLALERFYIKWYGRKDNNTGILHNKTDGGEGTSGYKHSNESIQKRSGPNNGQFGKPSWNKGIPRTAEDRIKMRKPKKSTINMSLCRKGKTWEELYGIDGAAKRRLAHKNRRQILNVSK